MTELVENRWQMRNVAIRKPMGARGDLYSVLGIDENGKPLSAKEKAEYFDPFIAEQSELKNLNRKITFFPQTIKLAPNKPAKPYFISHSAMREWEYEWEGMLNRLKVFPDIYEKSYKEWIIERIQDNSKFGRYKGGCNQPLNLRNLNKNRI